MRSFITFLPAKYLLRGFIFFVTAVTVFAAPISRQIRVGFLVADKADGIIGPDMDAACELAARISGAITIQQAGGGKFVDRKIKEVRLDQFDVIWCHHDDPTQPACSAFDPSTLDTLKKFASSGRSLLLSGCAISLITGLGIDTAARIEPLRFGHDRDQAGLIPFDPQHPVFRDTDIFRGVVWFSNAAFPAFGGFYPARNPAKGLFLARTPGGHENPLVEYQIGDGRVIAMGWRLGRLYGDAASAYRKNFEQLLSNIIAYLGLPYCWRSLAMRADGTPLGVITHKNISESECSALEMAIKDLTATFKGQYQKGNEYLYRLSVLRKKLGEISGGHVENSEMLAKQTEDLNKDFIKLHDESLLENPLLDFSKILFIRRNAKQLGLPSNYLSNSSLPQKGYDNQITVLSSLRSNKKVMTVYQPDAGRFVGDVDLHYDADRMLFSMSNINGKWRVFEIGIDGSNLREIPLIQEEDVDNYDACYLPDERIIFTSSACFAGVPCINGSGHVANLYALEKNGHVRQLTVEQDHDWCPAVLNNGQIMYLRWEYTDLPHAFSRILFHMNPDGTGQMEYYGSNSYWPLSMFFARPIPGHPTKFVAITGGHHELPRMGDMVVFDPALGRFEADGVVQQIPGHGRKLAPAVLDLPIAQTWPKFLHPYPLSEKYFLVSCRPSATDSWGIYLVDIFDNMILLHAEPDYAMFEPIPLRKTPRPPVVADKIDLSRKDADVFISDIYAGDGLKNVPRGSIKSIRIFTYEFAYQGMGAEPYSVGLDGPWDPRIILGTVPVYDDGSAYFRIPAYTPVSLQPLDVEGKAVQLMRSWFTAMPGEPVSCVGCHEKQNTLPSIRKTIAAGMPPAEINPWYGPSRGFNFSREVQPVLNKHCIRCHDGKPRADGKTIPALIDGPTVPTLNNKNGMNLASRFSPSYYAIRKFVRTPTKESDMHLLMPWEYHADTTRLVQMLAKGHKNVRLDSESWDRIITWIDLNAPAHGSWQDIRGAADGPLVKHQMERRRQMRERYTGMDSAPSNAIHTMTRSASVPSDVKPVPTLIGAMKKQLPDDKDGRLVRDKPGDVQQELSIDLGGGILLELVRLSPGEFVMGQENGCADENPAVGVKISEGFWIGRYEITNEQFQRFDPNHDSRLENADFMQFSPGERGWTVSRPRQPVVRVSWRRAMDFCKWLSEKSGRSFSLPTEAEWEYACRAGTKTQLWYGDLNSDFSRCANVSDASHQIIDKFSWEGRADVIPPWRPADTRFDDRYRVSAPAGTYRPNPWGLFDMHGNIAEWTLSEYRPYPYSDIDGRNSCSGPGRKVVRGGSWYDRPSHCRSAFRQTYNPDQSVYDVGFRVVRR